MKTALRFLFVLVLIVHGLIHLLGTAKGFGWGDVTALKQPISKGMAMVWLLAAVIVVAAGVTLALNVHVWWIVAVVAALVSQAVIVTSWSDAKAGTIANAALLVAATYSYVSQGSADLATQYS